MDGILITLEILGIIVGGIGAVIAAIPENPSKRSLESRLGRWRFLQKPWGLRWTVIGLAVALLMQMVETKQTQDGNKASAIQNSNTLHLLTEQASRIERMVTRFETFQIVAAYEIPLSNSVVKPLLAQIKKVRPTDTNGLGFAYVASTTNKPAEVLIDIDAVCASSLKNETATTNFLYALNDPEMVVDILAQELREGGRALVGFSTYDSGLLENPRLSYVFESNAPNGRLMVEWHVGFPKHSWYQSRHMTTADDVNVHG